LEQANVRAWGWRRVLGDVELSGTLFGRLAWRPLPLSVRLLNGVASDQGNHCHPFRPLPAGVERRQEPRRNIIPLG